MDYELVSVIKPTNNIWQSQKKRLITNKGKVISLSPSPTFNKLKESEGVEGINIFRSSHSTKPSFKCLSLF